MMEGEGETFWKNGRYYKGNYYKDRQEGLGVYKWGDGRVFYGYWSKGLQHGKGINIIIEPGGNKKEIRGIWEEGIKIKEINEGLEEILELKLKDEESKL